MARRAEQTLAAMTTPVDAISTSSAWPDTDAKDALLLLNSEDSNNSNADDLQCCRLKYISETGTLQLITAEQDVSENRPDATANAANDEKSNDDSGNIIDEIDIADVVGAELEVAFADCDDRQQRTSETVTTKHGWVGSLLASSSNQDDADRSVASGENSTEKDKIGGDLQAGSGYVSGRTSPTNLDPNALSLPTHPSDGEVPVSPRRRNRNSAVAYLNIYCYPRPKSSGSGWWSWLTGRQPADIQEPGHDGGGTADPTIHLRHRQAHHRRFEVAPTEDFAAVRSVVRAIRSLARGESMDGKGRDETDDCVDKPRKYLVIVNPYSGTGHGERTYNETVRPMLDQAGIHHDVCITKRSGHAMERMSERAKSSDADSHSDNDPAEDTDVSKYDAIIAMGGDGILWEMLQGIQARSDGQQLLLRLPFGIVGCGTSNGLAKSILHQCNHKYSPLESTFLICKGRTEPIDLSRYETTNGKVYTGFLTFSWAMIADVDLDSECIRFLGVLRNDIWCAYRILLMKSYRAKFSYLPPSAVEEAGRAVDIPPIGKPLPKEWKTIDDEFVLFWASQVTHAAYNTHQSPQSKLQDGLFRVMVVRKPISRFRMAMIALSFETGRHLPYDECEMYDCAAFRLEPADANSSHNDLDGEKIEDGPIQARVLPSAARFFA